MPSVLPVTRRPLVRSEVPERDAAKTLIRAAYAGALAISVKSIHSDEQLREAKEEELRALGDDRVIRSLLTRSATLPATTTGWANELAIQGVHDFVGSLLSSAAAKLIMAGTIVPFTALGIRIPRRLGLPTSIDGAWTTEGNPFAIRSYVMDPIAITPRKLIIGAALTHEMVIAGGQTVVETILKEDAAATLDATMFGSSTATTARPQGLLAQLDPAFNATAGGGDAAMLTDLEGLAAKIARNGARSTYYVMAPEQAEAALLRFARLRGNVDVANRIWRSDVLAKGTVIALDPTAFVSGFGADPRVEVSGDATYHEEDTSPLPLVNASGTVAANIRSAFQTDAVVVRVVIEAGYAFRRHGLVAYIAGATWGAQ